MEVQPWPRILSRAGTEDLLPMLVGKALDLQNINFNLVKFKCYPN